MWLVDILLPRRCVSCGVSADTLCGSCRASLRTISDPLCARCGAPTAWPVERCRECSGRRIAFACARAAIAYESGAPALVRAWKERGLRHIADLAAELVAERVVCPAADAIAYIPADRERELGRGHHPAAELARGLGRLWELQVGALLERARPVAHRQAELPLDERRRNVRGAFRACGPVPARIVLVDDVYTSGATVGAAATALRAAGARRVDVVTLARAVRGHRVR